MTRGQLGTWLARAEAMWGILAKLKQQMDQMQATATMLEAAGNADQLSKLLKDLATVQQQYERAEAKLLDTLNVASYDDAERSLVDFRLRFDQAEKQFQEWRTRFQQMELMVASGQVSESGEDNRPTRAAVEEIVTQARDHYDIALRLTEECVPNKAVVLLA